MKTPFGRGCGLYRRPSRGGWGVKAFGGWVGCENGVVKAMFMSPENSSLNFSKPCWKAQISASSSVTAATVDIRDKPS